MYINIRLPYIVNSIIHPEKKRSPRDFTSWLCGVDVSSPGTSCTAPALRNSEETKRQCWPVGMEKSIKLPKISTRSKTISSTQVRNQRYEWIMKQNLFVKDVCFSIVWFSFGSEMKWNMWNEVKTQKHLKKYTKHPRPHKPWPPSTKRPPQR